jgi:hypothetical protein
MDWLSLINTVILVIILFYQINRNKTMLLRIDSQHKLLEETKSVILQQKTAIESQSAVVDSALKYSDKFDVNKIEEIIKRETVLEYSEKIKSIEGNFRNELDNMISKDKLNEILKQLIKYITNLFNPSIAAHIQHLLSLSMEDKIKEIDSIENAEAKDFVKAIISSVEIMINEKH